MYIKFNQAINKKKDGITIFTFKKGELYNLPDLEANSYIAKGYAERFKLNIPKGEEQEKIKMLFGRLTKDKQEKEKKLADLLNALKLKPEPSEKLTTPAITDDQIGEFKNYFELKTDITASNLATMILAVYTYAKDIKDNQTLSKVSTDLLTLYRLTKFYDNNRNGKK